VTDQEPQARTLAVIRIWAAAAWSDGRLAPEEVRAMERLVEAAGLDDAARATARGYLERPVGLDLSEIEGLTERQKSGIYASAIRLVRIDRDLAPAEAAFLARLQRGLGLADGDARAIETGV